MAAGSWRTDAGIGDANVALVNGPIQMAMNATTKNQIAIADPVIQGILARDTGYSQLIGALGLQQSFAAIGQGKMTATAEGSDVAATNFTIGTTSLTPARREFARNASDMARALQEKLLSGQLAPDMYAMMVYEGYLVWGNTFIDLLVAHASATTYEAGTTGTGLLWSTIMHMVYDMVDRGNTGPIAGFISVKGIKDLADDTLSLGGAVQMSQQAQQFLDIGASGARIGTFFGNLHLYMNSELDTDGADTLGIAVGSEGLDSKHQIVNLPYEAISLVEAGLYTVELKRAAGGTTRTSVATYNATGIRQQRALSAIRYAT